MKKLYNVAVAAYNRSKPVEQTFYSWLGAADTPDEARGTARSEFDKMYPTIGGATHEVQTSVIEVPDSQLLKIVADLGYRMNRIQEP